MQGPQTANRYNLSRPAGLSVFLIVGLLWAAVLAAGGQTVAAEEAAIRITGERVGTYDIANDVFAAEGNVEVRYKDVTIEAGWVRFRMRDNIGTFGGGVTVHDGEQVLHAAALEFDFGKRKAEMLEVSTSVSVEGVQGDLQLSGDRIEAEEGKMRILNACLTTCASPDSGFYLAASEIELYPQDRVVIRRVRFVESGLTLFYWPSLTIPIKKTASEQDSRLELPQVGYSNYEGFFVKSAYWLGAGNARSRVLLDFMSRLGGGVGLEHYYSLFPGERGVLSAYHLYNQWAQHHDWRLGWEERLQLGVGLTADWNLLYEKTVPRTGIVTTNISGSLNVAHQTENGSASVDLQHDWLDEDGATWETNATLTISRDLGSGWRLGVGADVLDRAADDLPRRQLSGYRIDLSRAVGRYTFDAVWEDTYNPDLAKREWNSPTWDQVARYPELSLSSTGIRLGAFELPVDPALSWGRYREDPSGFQDNRLTLDLPLQELTWSLGRALDVSFSGGLRGDRYGIGLDRFVMSGHTGVVLLPQSPLRLELGYTNQEVFGGSPFQFDWMDPEEEVQGTLRLRTKWGEASVGTGYDFWNGQFIDVIASASFRPMQPLSIRSQAAYNIEENMWDYMAGTVQWTPSERTVIRLGAKVDAASWQLERADGQVAWAWPGWQVAYTGLYDGTNQTLKHGALSITRDLDCRLISLRYDQPNRAVWLEYRITAFPEGRVRLGTSTESPGLMFDAEGWESLFSQ